MKISTFRTSSWLRCATAIAAALLFLPGPAMSARQKNKTHVRRGAVHRRVLHHRRYKRQPDYTRVHLQPERVLEIQQALVKAGTLHEEPNGKWDDATREAMRQYQEQNGFAPTGLPEAKPLMKLGLGPHPLPPGLSSPPAGNSENQGNAEASTASGPTPAKEHPSSNQ